MNKHNQNGSVHIVLVSIVVIIILGGIGFLFWSNFLQPKPVEKTVTTTQASQSPSPSPSVVAKPETISLGDLGVKFTITSELKKAGIEAVKQTNPTVLADGSEGTLTNYYVTTSAQRAFGQVTEENLNKLCDAGSGVSVFRINTPSSTASQINAYPIGGFYYYWSIPSAGGCEGPDTKAIVAALKTIEVAN